MPVVKETLAQYEAMRDSLAAKIGLLEDVLVRVPGKCRALIALLKSEEWAAHEQAIEQALIAGESQRAAQGIETMNGWAVAELRKLWPTKQERGEH